MKRAIKIFVGLCLLLVVATFAYGAKGYFDALAASDDLSQRADKLMAEGRDGDGLGDGRAAQLLAVQDPGFFMHSGLDLWTPGAGLTTVTQSLAKRVGFDRFQPGIQKIRQTGFAFGLEHRLSKQQILALFLNTVEMGRGPDGWMTGFFDAASAVYRRPVRDLSENQFLSLVAVMIAPGNFDLLRKSPALAERERRIERLVHGKCKPEGLRDVWLQGCAKI